MPMVVITNHLKYYRERRAVSQQSLAHLCGPSKRTISRIERSQTRMPYPKTRESIAQALRVGVHLVFPPIRPRYLARCCQTVGDD